MQRVQRLTDESLVLETLLLGSIDVLIKNLKASFKMKTVISIQYKNYSANEIVTEENTFEIIDLLLTDKAVIDFEYIIEGDINLSNELGKTDYLCNFKIPSKVLTIEKMYNKMEEIKEEFCFTKAEEERNNLKIEKLEERAKAKTWDLKNIERLFI